RPQPRSTRGERSELRDDLRWLAACYFAAAVLIPVFGLTCSMCCLFGGLINLSSLHNTEQAGTLGGAIGNFAGGIEIFLTSLVLAGCVTVTGSALARQRHRRFCLIIAAVLCLLPPLGTILGVYTISLLRREAAKELFDHEE